MSHPHDLAGVSALAANLASEFLALKNLWASSSDPISIFQREADSRLFAVGFLRFVAAKRVGDYVKNAAVTFSDAPLIFPQSRRSNIARLC
jgi:hypothetical protein